MNAEAFLERCGQLRVMVIGDLMLDEYLWGDMERISPEAPVPVVDVKSREYRLGGAANAALNLSALGAMPLLCGIVGDDNAGQQLQRRLELAGFDSSCLLEVPGRKTTLKTRIICAGQQVLRVDEETRDPISESQRKQLLALIFNALPDCHALIFSDYDKGVLDSLLIRAVSDEAKRIGVKVCVDPKFRNFFAYEGCDLFKPNLKELQEGMGLRLGKDKLAAIEAAIGQLRQQMPHVYTAVTLGSQGMLLGTAEGCTHLPAIPRSVVDVSGAGDAVIAVLSLGLAAGLPLERAARWANIAGGLVCEEVGVAPLRLSRFAEAIAQAGTQN